MPGQWWPLLEPVAPDPFVEPLPEVAPVLEVEPFAALRTNDPFDWLDVFVPLGLDPLDAAYAMPAPASAARTATAASVMEMRERRIGLSPSIRMVMGPVNAVVLKPRSREAERLPPAPARFSESAKLFVRA